MTGYLLDTNIVSELRKGRRMHPQVARWIDVRHRRELYLSVITLAELRRGIALAAVRDPAKGEALERWYREIAHNFARSRHLLSIGPLECELWGELQGIRTLPVLDTFLAATAKAQSLILATRNTRDFEGLPVEVENPFEA